MAAMVMTRASGSLFGLAYGDALGAPTEFLTVAEIERRYGPGGPRELIGEPALVTDDTQMALAVAWALREAGAACAETGAGWIAEEALATALLCGLRHRDDAVAALGRAATTSGDSDSIACLTGAFLGAAYGMAAWPAGWAGQIEYGEQLTALGAAWDEVVPAAGDRVE